MRRVAKTAVLLCLLLGVAGISAYFTLRVIIKSEDTVVVPELVGRDVVYALDILTDLGLNIKVSGFEYRSDVPKNHVAYQHPGPGSEVKKDRDVRIVVSKGPKSFLVPNLVGMDIRQAHIIMEENGLVQGVLSRTFSDRAAEDEIVGHTPPSGTVVSRGDSMNLLVSLGNRPVTYQMPYLHGLVLEDAILILEKVHLGLGQIKSVQRNDLPMDVVVEQNPLAGYQVAAGTLVNLTMNRAGEAVLGRGLSLFHHRTHQGFLKKHIRFRVNAFGMIYDLYDVFMSPGEGVWLLTPEEPEATVFLYENGELVLSHSLASRSREDIIRDLAMDWD
jgi:eukaryotic-like serine/threonine-protein kinase